MRPWLVPLLLVSLTFAGCLDDARDTDPDDHAARGLEAVRHPLPEDPMPEGPGHDHGDPSQHRFLWNYDFSTRDPLLQDTYDIAGLHALDLQAGHLFGAVYGAHAYSTNGGLVIWDLADPAKPVQKGRWTLPGSVGGDRSMAATPDGDYVVIGTESVSCAGHVNPLSATVQAWLLDTRDKSEPKVVDVMTLTGTSGGDLLAGKPQGRLPGTGQHSVSVHDIGGTDHAFIWGKIFRIERGEDDAKLVYTGDIPGGHDAYIRTTPWNTTWALIALEGGSDAGAMLIYDVTRPEAPFHLAYWDLEGREELAKNGTTYYFHTTDVSFQDGQVVIVQTSEDFGDHVSPLWTIDGNPLVGITEMPAQPIVLETLGTWHNPGEHNALTGLTFSLHNPRFHDDGILTLASYHGGMWQLDVRHPEFWTEPAPIAYAAFADGTPPLMGDPVEGAVAENLCKLTFAMETPSYWDVEVGPNGIVYAADGNMGLYTFTPAASHPVYGADRTMEYAGSAGR